MRLQLGGVATFQVVRQNALKLKAIHTTQLPDTALRLGSLCLASRRLPLSRSSGGGLFGSVHPEEIT